MVAAMVTVSSIGLGNLYFVPEFAGPDFRTAAQVIHEQIGPEEGVVLVPGYAFPVWEYYYHSEGVVLLPDDPILDVRNVLHYSDVAPQVNEWLDRYFGIWLVQWNADTVDPTGVVPHLLGQVGEDIPLTTEMPNGISVKHYRFNKDQAPLLMSPETSPPQSQAFDLPLRLVGCSADRSVKGVDVACYW